MWTARGLTRFAVLFVIDLATRKVEIAGIVREPDSAWVVQCRRQLTDPDDGRLRGKRFLLHDRDPRFTDAFAETLAAVGVETVRLPPRSPNLNAYAERFVRTIKESPDAWTVTKSKGERTLTATCEVWTDLLGWEVRQMIDGRGLQMSRVGDTRRRMSFSSAGSKIERAIYFARQRKAAL